MDSETLQITGNKQLLAKSYGIILDDRRTLQNGETIIPGSILVPDKLHAHDHCRKKLHARSVSQKSML